MVYCVVARQSSRKVREALRRQFADDPTVQVVEDQRAEDRRSRPERRRASAARSPRVVDRRRVRHIDGRRVAERRAALGPSFRELTLPRVARHRADLVTIGSHVPRSHAVLDDAEATRLALAHQANDTRAFESLYRLWFDRIYTYLGAAPGAAPALEEAVNVAFTRIFDRLGDFVPAHGTFRRWVGDVLVELTLDTPGEDRENRTIPQILDRWAGEPDLEVLQWLRDEDLVLLLRQLPSPQREALALGCICGLDRHEVADVLDTAPDEVEHLEERALRFVSGCLTSLARRPGFSGRLPMVERRRTYPVTTNRKHALVA